MTEAYTIALLATLIVICLLIDIKNHRRLVAGDFESDQSNQSACDNVMLFAPFTSLFYAENFWVVSASIVGVILCVMAAQWLLHRFNYLRTGPEFMFVQLPGLAIIILLIYWLVFQGGEAIIDLSADSSQTLEQVDTHNLDEQESLASTDASVDASVETGPVDPDAVIKPTDDSDWLWWPFLIYAFVIVGNLTDKNENAQAMGLFVAFCSFSILPFFTNSFWIFWLLGIVIFFALLMRQAKNWGTGAGAASAFFFFYIMAAGLAALIKLGLKFFGLG